MVETEDGTAKDQVEKLMNELLPLARKMLWRHGEIFPFGAILERDGATTPLFVSPETDNVVDSQEVIDELMQKTRQAAETSHPEAAAIVMRSQTILPGSTTERTCIKIYLEHHSGYAAQVYFPYHHSVLRGLAIDKPFAKSHKPLIFTPSPT